MSRVAGLIFFKIDGQQYKAKGEFSSGGFGPVRETVMGADGPHGFKETPSVPFIEGEITDDIGLSMADLAAVTDSTVMLELANGKTHSLRNGFGVNPDGLVLKTSEASIAVRFEGSKITEI